MFLTFAYFETKALIGAGPFVLWFRGLIAIIIFAHNSLVASVVALGMLFLKELNEVLPKKLRRTDLLKHPRALSLFFSVMLILSSALHFSGGLDGAIRYVLPVAAIEAYAIYSAALAGLLKRPKNMLKSFVALLMGALIETSMILSTL
ncbi:MAG: hypothetical protein QXG35_08675 [Nitrososphaerota archaeon]